MHIRSHKFSITLSVIAALTFGLLAGQAEAFKPLTTKVIKGGDQPFKISVDITGAKNLWLLATSGPDDYHHDRAAWGSPVLIDAAGKKIDLTTIKPTALTSGHGGLRINKGLSANVLQIGRKKFKKGLLLHAPSSIHFKLDGKYVRFEAEVGIGAGAGKNGSCTFRVLDKYDPAGMKKYPLGKKVYVEKGAPRGRPARAARAATPIVNIKALGLAIADLTATYKDRYPKGAEYAKRLETVKAMTAGEEQTKAFKALQTEALLANPLLDFDKLLVVRRKGNLGMPANWCSNSSIRKTGYDNDISVLSPVTPDGKLTTLFKPKAKEYVGEVDLHFNADKMLFSMPSEGGRGAWQIHEIKADGTGLRQVSPTRKNESYTNNYDACYLPNGEIIYTSTAPHVAVPCVRGSAPAAMLFRMKADGTNIRQLCFDQEHSWHPVVRQDGTILYSRWEYADLPHSNSRMMFTMNPDGTNQRAFYGSGSFWPNSTFYSRPVPGHSTMFVGVITGHHAPARTGELIVFDPARGTQEADGVVQRIPGHGLKVEPLIQDGLTRGSWPKFLTPYPLSEKHHLVSMKPNGRAPWGIYLVDTFDNMLLIKESAGYAMLEPVPFRKTPMPRIVPDRVDPSRKDAIVMISNIYYGPGLAGVPKGEVKKLRLYTYTFGYGGVGGLYGSIGMDGPWDMRRTLGTVPVEPDGSASFVVPANTPIAVQPLDSEGKSMQVMRSWFTAMPGETLSCLGCHEDAKDAPPAGIPTAARKAPAKITPWHGPARNYEFTREVQPVLDKFCVGCHNGQKRDDGKTLPDLRGTEMLKGWTTKMAGNTGKGTGGKFSISYGTLHRYVRRPGIESPMPMMTPMEFHADTTELVQMLIKGHNNVKLDAEAWERLYTWIDLNAPYHGRWSTLVGKKAAESKEMLRAMTRKLYANVDENHEFLPKMSVMKITPIIPEPLKPSVPVKINGWPLADAAALVKDRKPLSIELAKDLKMELVYVPAGKFVIGSTTGYTDEAPAAPATIAKGFWMGKLEVTNAQFRAFDAKHDSREEDRHGYQFGIPGYTVNEPDMPAVRLSWRKAVEFCKWMSAKTGKKVTLPTEAQWEWACRAGTDTEMSFGKLGSDFSTFGNMGDITLSAFSGNPYRLDWKTAQYKNPTNIFDNWIPQDGRFNDGCFVSDGTGKYKPNAWGLHDMHGNVAEWTRSLYKPYPYSETDGRNDITAKGKRVIRGGSWYDRPKRCTSSYRFGYRDYQKVYNVGFRVVIEE
ncbi:MAG: SUMF1/EgtB/PvdO family nonheme iron enzyme [Phycisphaerae bacterium]|nr:SUMF1/EgtB/PvdO family nonheme iron enzyme [Phycisphaerae bacterium]